MNTGPQRHNVVSSELVQAIETFFAASDWKGRLWLTGGTCLAEYYFGHRVSLDMDLFTVETGAFAEAQAVLNDETLFADIGRLETVRRTAHFCQYLLHCPGSVPIKIDLTKDMPVTLDDKVQFGGVWLDSLLDLVSNKVGCLLHRHEAKDYVDLFYLLPHLGLSAAQALELGLKKEAGLDPLILAAQMQFIQDEPRPDFLVTDAPWESVLYFFRQLREEVLDLIEPRAEPL